MKVKDLFIALIRGKMVVQDREGNKICEVVANSTIQPIMGNYKILVENNVLNDEVYYIEVINNIMYVTIK